MAQGWSSQSGDDLDDIDAWMAQRNAQLGLRTQADAFARNLWNQATQDDAGLYAGNSSDLTAIGLAALGGASAYPTAAANDDGQDGVDAATGSAAGGGPLPSTVSNGGSQQGSSLPADPVAPSPQSDANYPSVSELNVVGQPASQTPHAGFLDDLNHNPFARLAAGVAGYGIGLPAGAVRSGWHAIEGVGDGLNFARSLLSPEGRAEALNEAKSATHNVVQYGRSVIANPSRLANFVVSVGKAAIRDVVPTSMADTALGEFGHEFGLGKNAGEALTNVVGAVALPEVAEGINAALTFAVTRDANIAKFMGQGFDEQTARYLSKPYDGRGDHAVISRSQNTVFGFKTPLLKKVPIPEWLKDSPLNVSKPRGMSQGDFYEYHYGVDPQFYGAKLPRDLNGGKGWSGRRLGAERYSGTEQLWRRTPQIWKDYAAGAALGEDIGQLTPDDPDSPQ